MAKLKKSRNQQTVQEDAIVQELLAELQAIEEWRQCAVRFHQLMNQRCHLGSCTRRRRIIRERVTAV
jgi:hypothetical protein